MPSSAQTACYNGPSCVYPQPPATQAAMHPYYCNNSKNNAANSTTNSSARARLLLQDTSNPNASSSGRFHSPITPRMEDNRRHLRNHTSGQHNGQTDLMSLSVHSPNPHYWPTATNSVTPVTSVSPYAHSTVPTSVTSHNFNNYCGINATNPNNFDFGGKQNGTGKPTSNGSGKASGNRPLWKERPHVGRYSLIRTIGKGNFAKVKLAQHLTTGMQVAVKVIDKTLLNHSSMQKLFREVRVLKTLNHPNIIKLLEVIESERHLYLVMEYASGGEVFDYLVSHGKMKESVARVKFRQIVSAVQYCHQKMVVHRDLKAENLLLDEDLNIKIADFGFSNYFSPSQKLDTFCGSPPYAAPELFLGRKYDGPEVDVWSLGVILYTLVSGTLPFDGKNLKELRERVLRGTYRVPFYLTHECEMLLKKMLVLNPAKRLPLAEVMRDPWLNTGFDTILRPFSEPPADYCDPLRIETMVRLGFQRHEIEEALTKQRFNNITATYILLARYNPAIHGRLPGLPSSTSGTRASTRSSDTRSRPIDFTLNGTTQVVKSDTSPAPGSRPSSAIPFSNLNNNNKFSSIGRRDESFLSRNGSNTARTGSKDSSSTVSSQTRRDSLPTSSAQTTTSTATTTSASSSTESNSAISTAKSIVEPLEDWRVPNSPLTTSSIRPQALRRSATTMETKVPSNTNTNIKTISEALSGVSITPRTPPSTFTPVSSDPSSPTMIAPASHPHPPVHPSVTTAHLTLTNGSSTQHSPSVRLTSSPPTQSSHPSSRSASVTTAPLAHDEDEVTGKKERSTNGTHDRRASSSSSSSSSSSAADSDSDVYDRECGSGSSETSTHPVADTGPPPCPNDSKVTSVVVAAAPAVTGTSNGNRRAPDARASSDELTTQLGDSRVTRLPSFRRGVNIRSSAEPTTGVRTNSEHATAVVTSTQANSRPIPTVKTSSGSVSPKPSTTLGSANNRGLLRGTPNVADILNETNPFRLASDTPRSATTLASSPPASQPTTIVASSTVTSARTFSPSPPTASGHVGHAVATRRPVAPPPLATATLTEFPSRTSYAYHSLRLPSSTTTTAIAMGKTSHPAASPSSFWLRGRTDEDDGMATPTPFSVSEPRDDPYSIPFSRNLPERSTIQYVPTGRARERLETPSVAPRLVRHPGTHSIANQSMRLRARSPPYITDPITPRPASPDDLSLSSVNSSASTLGQCSLGPASNRKDTEDFVSNNASRKGGHHKQSNTLGSPVLFNGQQSSVRPTTHREGSNNGPINNFFRSLTTRISRSKFFRRSALIQPSDSPTDSTDQRNRMDAMNAPTMELDKLIVSRGSPSPEGISHSTRLPRSRSGVTPHRPVSQVAPRHSDFVPMDGNHTFRRSTSRRSSHDRSADRFGPPEESKGTLGRKWSKRSTSSQEARASRRSTPSKETQREDSTAVDEINPSEELNDTTLGRSKSRRSMRYVLKPFAKWPLDEVMVEVQRALTNQGVDFELIGERKLQCVYGDPSVGRGTTNDKLDQTPSVVHWEMEVGKLAGVGMNGIRFKRINGSMATFKQIAKKLAADLRF